MMTRHRTLFTSLLIAIAISVATPARAAIALVPGQAGGNACFASTCAFTLPSNVGAGHLLIYGHGWGQATNAATDNNGNTIATVTTAAGGSTVFGRLDYVANSNAGATTVTVGPGGSSTTLGIGVAEYSGALTVSPLDQFNTGNGTGTAASTANVTTTQADELLAVITIGGLNGGTTTPGTNYTERSDNASSGQVTELEERIVAATNTYAGAATLGTSQTAWCEIIGTFKAAASSRTRTLLGVGQH